MPAINNVSTANAYTDATTLRTAPVPRISGSVANAAVFYQLALNDTSGEAWESEIFLPPGFHVWDAVTDFRNGLCRGIRFRSAAPGNPAQISIRA